VRSVLIVDDSLAIRKALCEFFTRQGDFEICGEAENGSEAIEKALLLQPALIVTDLWMPLMNGLEETRILKKLLPAVPVIIYTAHNGPTIEKEGLAAGASAVMSKSDDRRCSSVKRANCLTESPLDYFARSVGNGEDGGEAVVTVRAGSRFPYGDEHN
jgi:DNA-binding NarL/FixJ family response regulator